MAAQKLSLSFNRYKDADLLNKASFIYCSMQANPVFSNPVPGMGELQAAISKYDNSLLAATDGSRMAIADKNNSRKALQALLVRLALYVMYVADGNVSMMTGSGFSLTKQPEPRYITNPGNVRLSNGITSGQLVSKVKVVKSATHFIHEIAAEEPTAQTLWQSNPSSRTRYVFSGLVPGKKYWIRVGAVARGQQLAYSPITSVYVQ